MLASARLVAFLATRDPQRAKAFFGQTLGLRLVNDDGFSLVFDANGTPLRIATVSEFTPHAFTSAGWEVDDIAATVTGLVAKGVTFQRFTGMEQDSQGIWNTPSGAKVAWFKDPDGNLLSVTQMENADEQAADLEAEVAALDAEIAALEKEG
jgi:catechol 2,3-dioxygenase-like lactoylglutathione lyase family enzyme